MRMSSARSCSRYTFDTGGTAATTKKLSRPVSLAGRNRIRAFTPVLTKRASVSPRMPGALAASPRSSKGRTPSAISLPWSRTLEIRSWLRSRSAVRNGMNSNTGSARKITSKTANLNPSECQACRSAPVLSVGKGIVSPPISEPRIVLDGVECPVDVTKLLPDTLDKGPDIGAIPIFAVTGDESLPMHQTKSARTIFYFWKKKIFATK